METVREVTYLGDRLSIGEGYETVVSARTRCALVKFRECGKLLYEKMFHLMLYCCLQELCKASNYVWT